MTMIPVFLITDTQFTIPQNVGHIYQPYTLSTTVYCALNTETVVFFSEPAFFLLSQSKSMAAVNTENSDALI